MGAIFFGSDRSLKTHFISNGNSTSAILGAGATFTGVWEDVEQFATAAVTISGNLAAEPGTLFFDLSQDGVNIHATVPASIPNSVFFDKPHILNLVEKYIRIRYTNGATPQTTFDLQTKYSNAQQLGLLNSIGEPIYDTSEGTIVRAVLNGSGADGLYRNAGVNKGGALEVADFLTEVALGNIPGHSEVQVFGFKDNIDVGIPPIDIYNGTGDYPGQPVGVSDTVDVVSNIANDTSAGSGAQQIYLYGLDALGVEQSETVSTNGTTPVTSANTYSRVLIVEVSGPNSNEGTITVRHTSTPANIFANLAPGVGKSEAGAFTIPSNKVGVLLNYYVISSRSNGSPGSGVLSLRKRVPGGSYIGIRYENFSTSSANNPPLGGGIVLEPGTDIKVRVETVSDNDTSVSVSFTLLLIDV